MVVAPVAQRVSPRSTLETTSRHGTQTVVFPSGVMTIAHTPSGGREYQTPTTVASDEPVRRQTAAQQLYCPHGTSHTTWLQGGAGMPCPTPLSVRNAPTPMRTVSQREILSSGASTQRGFSAAPTPRTLSTAATSITNANRSQDSASLYQSGESSGVSSSPRVFVGTRSYIPNMAITPAQIEAQLQREFSSLNAMSPMERECALHRIHLLTELKRHQDMLSQPEEVETTLEFNTFNSPRGGFSTNFSSPRTVQRSGMAPQGSRRMWMNRFVRNSSENNTVSHGHASSQSVDRDFGRRERINRLQNDLRIYYESLKRNGPASTLQTPRSYHASVPSSPRHYERSMASAHPPASARSSVSAAVSPREGFAILEQAFASPRSIFVSESSQENYFNVGCGLSPDLIQELPISRYQSSVSESSEEQKSCTICLEDFVSAEFVRRLPCTHAYHTRCIDEWLSRSTKCPICKWDCVRLIV